MQSQQYNVATNQPLVRPRHQAPILQCLLSTLVLLMSGVAARAAEGKHGIAPDMPGVVRQLLQESCLACHDAGADIDLTLLPANLDSTDAFRQWEVLYDRVNRGEMPPADAPRPVGATVTKTLEAIRHELHAASRTKQETVGRVVARRLTKLELKYTLEDLFDLPTDGSRLANWDLVADVPDEDESETFNTVGARQRISPMHIAAYLRAASRTVQRAFATPPDDTGPFRADFRRLRDYHDLPFDKGGGVSRPALFSQGIILFADVDHLTPFPERVSRSGVYRLSAKVTSVQSRKHLTAKIVVESYQGELRIAKAVDLAPDETQFLTVDTFMLPGSTAHVTIDLGATEAYSALIAAGGARGYKGPGLAITYQAIEGPLSGTWPPVSALLPAIDVDSAVGRSEADVRAALNQLAPRIFRRDVDDKELNRFLRITQSQDPASASTSFDLDTSLQAMLTAPQFLVFEESLGALDDFAIANRLSYFLWRSLPDKPLFDLARQGKLRQPEILKQEVGRMLADHKAQRFVEDLAGQWLRLSKVNATQPDLSLYPEFDNLLADSIPRETHEFLKSVFRDNLSIENFVDSKFAFLNRRLAEHYGIKGVEGLEMRRVDLPAGSVRGGLLTQAAILKTTANGTVTSPVVRGNFVLSNLLGTPPDSPPAGVTSIEPDTRGAKTIRELLQAHRTEPECNRCHSEIDPPGFALESFDPTGGFRERYRQAGARVDFGEFSIPGPPQLGLPVDASGYTAEGLKFNGIAEYKKLLLSRKRQIARNFAEQLIVFATGGQIEFADRSEVERIVASTEASGFRARDIVEAIVTSPIFLHK